MRQKCCVHFHYPVNKRLLLCRYRYRDSALDIVGIFDPAPILDGINAKLSADKGDWGNALMSVVGIVPYIGDVAKVGKVGKDYKIIRNAIEAVSSAGQKIGPSGQAMVHTVKKSSPKKTEEVARRGGSGTPVFHNKDKKRRTPLSFRVWKNW